MKDLGGPNQKYVEEDMPLFPHPVVRAHPVTGRKSLHVSYLSLRLTGPGDPDPGGSLLRDLHEHVEQPHLYYTHAWRPGDAILWDNRRTNHRQEGSDAAVRRDMYRVRIAGTRPF